MDLELTASNLLNNNEYAQQFYNTYAFVQSNFELRRMQFLLLQVFVSEKQVVF
jgi:hypothetical protein